MQEGVHIFLSRQEEETGVLTTSQLVMYQNRIARRVRFQRYFHCYGESHFQDILTTRTRIPEERTLIHKNPTWFWLWLVIGYGGMRGGESVRERYKRKNQPKQAQDLGDETNEAHLRGPETKGCQDWLNTLG